MVLSFDFFTVKCELDFIYQTFLGVVISLKCAGVAQLWLDARKGRFKRWTHKVIWVLLERSRGRGFDKYLRKSRPRHL